MVRKKIHHPSSCQSTRKDEDRARRSVRLASRPVERKIVCVRAKRESRCFVRSLPHSFVHSFACPRRKHNDERWSCANSTLPTNNSRQQNNNNSLNTDSSSSNYIHLAIISGSRKLACLFLHPVSCASKSLGQSVTRQLTPV